MGISKISEKKPPKSTLAKKSIKIENGKSNQISKPLAKSKKSGLKSIKGHKDFEVTETVKQNVAASDSKTSKKIKKDIKKRSEKVLATETKTKNKETSKSKAVPKVEPLPNLKTELADHVEHNENSAVQKRNLKRKRSIVKTEDDKKEGTDDGRVKKKGLKRKLVTQKTSNKQNVKVSNVVKGEKEEETEAVSALQLTKEHILECITAVFHLTEEQIKKNSLFASDAYPIFLQVTCIRIPKTPRRQIRITLPHTMVSENDEVALFVRDLERGRRKDFEPSVEHYRNLLNEHGCTRVKDIIPLNQLKTEYDQFELKRRLLASYDHFLVDGRITGHVSHILGKAFVVKRKLPTPIHMNSKDLKHEIDYALSKTCMHMHSNGNCHLMQIGTTSMKKTHVLKNILAVCEALKKSYPGGWDNIRSLRIKGTATLGLPIYVTLKNKNSVEVPVVQPKRPKAYHTVEGELTTLSRDTTITVTPEGDINVDEKEESSSEDEDEDEETSIKEEN